jgi:hypothetical protein
MSSVRAKAEEFLHDPNVLDDPRNLYLLSTSVPPSSNSPHQEFQARQVLTPIASPGFEIDDMSIIDL